MYEKPIKSSKLNIDVVSNLSENTKSITLTEIKKKMMLFPLNEIEFIALPIMHSDPSAKTVLWLLMIFSNNNMQFIIIVSNNKKVLITT